ncbi:MAG: hypothetical protein ABEJ31_02790 [Haloarculaceae archaeon]
MSDPATVKRTLARLADRAPAAPSTPLGSDRDDYRTVVDAGTAATDSLAAAAAFADEVGVDRLAAAVERAAAQADHAAARRGRRALAAFDDARSALESPGDGSFGCESAAEATDDHFRSGRGMPLWGSSERRGK